MRNCRSILLFVLGAGINVCLASPSVAASALGPSGRIVHFPADRSLGKLHLQMLSPGTDSKPRLERSPTDCGEYLAKARGDVRISADGQLTLMVDPGAVADLSDLSRLQPDDLYGIAFPPGPGGSVAVQATPSCRISPT
jgi:hypothetical protein